MSRVSSVILQVSCSESGFGSCVDIPLDTSKIDKINKWLKSYDKFSLVDLTGMMPRGKGQGTMVFGGGYNYFPEEEFSRFILNMSFSHPRKVVLIIDTEARALKVFRPNEFDNFYDSLRIITLWERVKLLFFAPHYQARNEAKQPRFPRL